MWSNKGNDDNAGGGYFGSDYKSSPSGPGGEGGEKKVFKAQNCVPVTIGHIQKSTEDNLKVGKHAEAHVLTLLGRLVKKETDSTKLSYTIDDGTGVINCFDFKFNDMDGSTVNTDVQVNQYYRVFGSLRMTEGVHHVMTFRIEPLQSVNELTMHLLEVMYAPAHLDELELGGQNKGNGFGMPQDNPMKNSMADVNMENDFAGGSNNMSGFSRTQQAVYEIVKSFNNQEKGIHEGSIPEALPMKLSLAEVRNILDFLVGEGHVYTTTDNQHFRTTDG